MHNGDIDRIISRRRLLAAAVAVVAAGSLAACKTSGQEEAAPGTAASRTAAPSPAAAKPFGTDGYGRITFGMSEREALATGDLQTSPVSIVLRKKVYSFVGGPKPDPKRMAEDEKMEKAVEKADKLGSNASGAEAAKAAEAYADSADRIADRLGAYLDAGGAVFVDGKLVSLAAPADASTEAGIKRGSTAAELKAAYGGKGLKKSEKNAYQLPVGGAPGWTMLFEVEGDAVRFMSLGRSS